jgi:hypothetical protein
MEYVDPSKALALSTVEPLEEDYVGTFDNPDRKINNLRISFGKLGEDGSAIEKQLMHADFIECSFESSHTVSVDP